jgi:hypothetical protein
MILSNIKQISWSDPDSCQPIHRQKASWPSDCTTRLSDILGNRLLHGRFPGGGCRAGLYDEGSREQLLALCVPCHQRYFCMVVSVNNQVWCTQNSTVPFPLKAGHKFCHCCKTLAGFCLNNTMRPLDGLDGQRWQCVLKRFEASGRNKLVLGPTDIKTR